MPLAAWFLLLLRPGIGLKRWLLLGVAGVLIVALGIATTFFELSETTWVARVGRAIDLSGSLGPVARGAGLGGIGMLMVVGSALMFYRRVAQGARYTQGQRGIVDSLSRHRARSGGLRVVAIGGGTGLSTALRGLKEHTDNITAVVTVADDGGSSGRLRSELNISPPGDARQCLIALSESEPLMERALTYRFEAGLGLEGHNLGNLLIAALVHTEGNFHDALQAAAKLLVVHGQVAPSSVASDLRLKARTASGIVLDGESAIGHAGEPLEQLWLEPGTAPANPAAIAAIDEAQVIVMGPGSLYTSVLPNFLVTGMSEAVRRSKAPKVFVCNIATQHGETDGLSAEDHLRVFEEHSGAPPTHFLVNNHIQPLAPRFEQEPVTLNRPLDRDSTRVVLRDLLDESFPSRHDPRKLAAAILRIARS